MTGLSLVAHARPNPRSWLALALLLTIGWIAAPALAQTELTTEDDETLYLIGTSVARTLEAFQLSEEELSVVIRGLEALEITSG